MSRLFWKVYLPLAVCVIMTLFLAVFAMTRIIPAQVTAYRESIQELTDYLLLNDDLGREDILEKAEELDLDILVTEAQLRPGGPGGMMGGPMMHTPPENGYTRLPGMPPDYPWIVDVSFQPRGGPGGWARQSFWILLLLLLVTEGFVLFFALWPVRKRLSRLNWATTEFGSGNLGVRVHENTGGDFIDSLGRSFNGMAGDIETLVASHRELLGIVAHELRTPMTRMRLALELIREDSGDGEFPKLDSMERDLVALDLLVTELLAFNRLSRTEEISREETDVADLCRTLAESESWSREDISTSVSGSAAILADQRLLGRALGNLVRNAVTHAVSRVQVTVSVLPGGETRISVEDDGPGFEPAIADRLGEPFVKGTLEKGTGLGLAIAGRIAALHDGRLEFGDSEGLGGARADLIL